MKAYRSCRRRLARSGVFGVAVAWLVLFGAGCATSSQRLRLEARESVLEGRWDDAEKTLLRQEILSDAKGRVLTLLELGTVAHLSGEYEKSNRILFSAKEMVEHLFTRSISEAASTWVLNDLNSTYSGLDYERSLIHYYIVLNFLQLAQADAVPAWELQEIKIAGKLVFAAEKIPARELDDKLRRESLQRARAEVLAWDTTLETIRNRNRGLPVYKDDLLAKVLGAQAHLMMGTREDVATARVLYQDAARLLERAYNLYPTFNEKFGDFARDFASLPNLPDDVLASRYIASTPEAGTLKSLVKSAAEEGVESPGEKDAGQGLFLLELGMIPAKREKVFTIGLSSLFGQIEDPRTRALVEEIGARALLQFAPIVGIGYVSVAVVGAATAGPRGPHHLSSAFDRVLGFEFKLPEIPRSRVSYPKSLLLAPAKGGKPIELPVAAVNPIGDFAAQEVDTASAAVAAKTGVRVGVKYLGALAVAFGTYRQLARSNEFAATLAASAAYMGAKAAIDASEAADTRAWALLPHAVAAARGRVPAGDYDVRVVGAGYSSESLGTISVAAGRRQVFKWRVLSVPEAKPTPGPTRRRS